MKRTVYMLISTSECRIVDANEKLGELIRDIWEAKDCIIVSSNGKVWTDVATLQDFFHTVRQEIIDETLECF